MVTLIVIDWIRNVRLTSSKSVLHLVQTNGQRHTDHTEKLARKESIVHFRFVRRRVDTFYISCVRVKIFFVFRPNIFFVTEMPHNDEMKSGPIDLAAYLVRKHFIDWILQFFHHIARFTLNIVFLHKQMNANVNWFVTSECFIIKKTIVNPT